MIDLNKGVTRRRHPMGAMISCYKSEPGRWYDDEGNLVEPQAASQAGFDVENSYREQRKLERLAEARRRVEQEFARSEHELALQEATIEEEAAESQAEQDQRGAEQYRLHHMGFGKWQVFDPDGNHMLDDPVSKDEAETERQRLERERAQL